MQLVIPRETQPGEDRVSATPETVKKLVRLGAEVVIESGAGTGAGISDADYEAAGASIGSDRSALLGSADMVLRLRKPEIEEISQLKGGCIHVSYLDPFNEKELIKAFASHNVTAVSMEMIPRSTRSQKMDALSSQANLAGYMAVMLAANNMPSIMPMMMTPAGTLKPAKVFIIGAGVAGLQAIATARRLGAVVSATDVRPAAKEQVGSLGAKFVAVEDDEFKEAETAGGYAKEMSDDYKAKQAELVASHIAKQDIVITTALIPGRPAPRLITTAMVESMKPGSVIIDIAAANGGNCELTEADKVVEHNGVKIAGFTNLPARLAADSSQLLAKNLVNLFPLLVGEDAAFAPHWDDEVIKGMALTRDGAIIHPSLTGDA